MVSCCESYRGNNKLMMHNSFPIWPSTFIPFGIPPSSFNVSKSVGSFQENKRVLRQYYLVGSWYACHALYMNLGKLTKMINVSVRIRIYSLHTLTYICIN